MPGGDRTGPLGHGPRTGRAAGFCSGFAVPGYRNEGPLRGGRGGWGNQRFEAMGARGRGRGRRNQYGAIGLPGGARYGGAALNRAAVMPPATGAMAAKDEMEMLDQQARFLEQSLDDIRKRKNELSATLKVETP